METRPITWVHLLFRSILRRCSCHKSMQLPHRLMNSLRLFSTTSSSGPGWQPKSKGRRRYPTPPSPPLQLLLPPMSTPFKPMISIQPHTSDRMMSIKILCKQNKVIYYNILHTGIISSDGNTKYFNDIKLSRKPIL